jgi:hypothetical protein
MENPWNDAQIEQRNKRESQYNSDPKLCKECNETIPYEKRANKYCSLNCFNLPRKVTAKCQSCNKPVRYNGNKFCSNACQVEAEWSRKVKDAEASGKAPDQQRAAKKLVERMRGHSCEICRGSEWMQQPMPLILDHIDGNSRNWDLSNLRLVCGNCDMQLPTYKSKNRGKGRLYDRDYKRRVAGLAPNGP